MFTARNLLAVAAAGVTTVVVTLAAMQDTRVAGLVVGVFLAVILARRPAAALTLWLASLLYVPYWVGVDLGGAVPLSTLVAIVVLPAIVIARKSVRWRAADTLVLAGSASLLLAAAIAGSPTSTVRAILVGWIPAYIVMRVLAARVGTDRTAIIFVVLVAGVAAWGLIEFATGFHPFTDLESTAGWNLIQSRGGVSRSEAALGHSIVMGGVVASAIPFALTMRARAGVRLGILALLIGGVLVTFSRGGMIAAAIGLVLGLLLSPRRNISLGTRVLLSVAVLGAAVVVAPQVLTVFDASGSELQNSSDYRLNVLNAFSKDVAIFGLGNGLTQTPTGLVYQGFGSIDNAYILMLLQFGWVPTVLVFAAPVMVALGMFRWRSGPSGIAVTSMLVLATTVALILQLGPLLFLLTAAGASAREPQPTPPPEQEAVTDRPSLRRPASQPYPTTRWTS